MKLPHINGWWLPGQTNERIISVFPFQEVIVIATDRCIYVASDEATPLSDHKISVISKEVARK